MHGHVTEWIMKVNKDLLAIFVHGENKIFIELKKKNEKLFFFVCI